MQTMPRLRSTTRMPSRRAFIEQRYRRVARLEHRRELKRARRRFWILVAMLLLVAVFLSVTIWEQIQSVFGI